MSKVTKESEKINITILISKALAQILEELDLLSNKAVYFRKSELGKTFVDFTAETSKKIEIIKPDAFYVFNNQPYVLFFDLSTKQDLEREQEIHKQVWSFDNAPVIFIIKNNEVQIFNAFNYEKKKEKLQEIKLSKEERNEIFSFWPLQSGESWKWLQEKYYKSTINKKRVNQKLFENIKLVRELLMNNSDQSNLNENEANILILRLIFIRYLIDRDVQLDPDYINGNTILERRKSFSTLIEDIEKLGLFFRILNDKLNGVLFEDTNIKITTAQAKSLSYVFNGKDNYNQQSLFDGADFYFEIFDFSIIPVEVISGIYESLINLETRYEQSAIYTPSFLVEYILSETVDKYLEVSNKPECKVFDPACGSGIFLVQSYRRMVDKEKSINNGKITKDRLKEIAQNNLFGTDLNAQALQVTCFSIYIALLDYQDPKTILDNFVFPKLVDENLFTANFFDITHPFNEQIKSKKLDFIVGNPPWKSNKEEDHVNWLKASEKTTGRYEIAQSFLLRSEIFMNPKTVSALIVTSTIFYNVSLTTRQFKKDFLTTFCLDRFFDLSPVRRLIFEEKNSPATVVYYRLSDGNSHLKNVVTHISIKSNIFLKYFKSIIIEKQDYKEISQLHFIENDWMFKLALYGGVLDFNFIKKIHSSYDELAIFLKKENYRKGDGIYKGTPKRDFNFLIGKSIIETDEVMPFFTNINQNKKLTQKDVFLESGRKEELFADEAILLKHRTKDEQDIVVSYVNKPVVFRHGTYGITKSDDFRGLKLVYGYLISKIFTYYQFLTSSAWGIATRPEVKLEEHVSFPFAVPNLTTQNELIDLVDNFLSPIKEWHSTFKLGEPSFPNQIYDEINSLINQIYQVSGIERDLIDYVHQVSRLQFQESKQTKFTKKVNNDVDYLEQFADVFIEEFAGVYDQEFLSVDVYPLNYFVAMNFSFSKENEKRKKVNIVYESSTEKEILQRLAQSLSISKIASADDPTKNLYIQKDIKGFEVDSFYIIKPNEYKCWHRAMAWYDVAEIKEAIEQAEINYLTSNSHAS